MIPKTEAAGPGKSRKSKMPAWLDAHPGKVAELRESHVAAREENKRNLLGHPDQVAVGFQVKPQKAPLCPTNPTNPEKIPLNTSN